MSKFIAVLAVVFSISGMAIEFITEDQVAKQLGAEKVIEVSKYKIESLIPTGSACDKDFSSRSARAYVVKIKQNNQSKSALYLTRSGLADLNSCTDL